MRPHYPHTRKVWKVDENLWTPPLRRKRCTFLCEKVGVPDYVVNNAGAWAFQDFCDKYEENFLSCTYDIWTDVQSYTRFFQSIQRMPSCSFCYILVGLPLDKEKIQNYPKIGQWNGTPCIFFIFFSDYESWDWMIDVNIRGHLNVISRLYINGYIQYNQIFTKILPS